MRTSVRRFRKFVGAAVLLAVAASGCGKSMASNTTATTSGTTAKSAAGSSAGQQVLRFGGTNPLDAPARAACLQVFSRQSTQPSNRVVLVIDRTASVADMPVPAGFLSDITKASLAGGSLTVIEVDGAGQTPRILAKTVALSTAGARDRPSVATLAQVMPACVTGVYLDAASSTGVGTDLYRAMSLAAEVVRSGSMLWTISDLLPNTGQLNLTSNLLADSPQRAAARAVANAPLNLAKLRWNLTGIGDSTGALLPVNRTWLTAFGQQLCLEWKASGCSDIALDPVNPVRSTATGLPADPRPPFPGDGQSSVVNGCSFTLPGGILFDRDSAVLLAEANSLLGGPIALLLHNPTATAVIVGHTASVPGSSEYQLKAFSMQRAQAVLKVMSAAGIDQHRLSPQGVGDTQPLAEDVSPSTGQVIESVAVHERRVTVTVLGARCDS